MKIRYRNRSLLKGINIEPWAELLELGNFEIFDIEFEGTHSSDISLEVLNGYLEVGISERKFTVLVDGEKIGDYNF